MCEHQPQRWSFEAEGGVALAAGALEDAMAVRVLLGGAGGASAVGVLEAPTRCRNMHASPCAR
eukprot:3612625-Alexandrium_andersonii.AAC.1